MSWKKLFKKWWFWLIIALILLIGLPTGLISECTIHGGGCYCLGDFYAETCVDSGMIELPYNCPMGCMNTRCCKSTDYPIKPVILGQTGITWIRPNGTVIIEIESFGNYTVLATEQNFVDVDPGSCVKPALQDIPPYGRIEYMFTGCDDGTHKFKLVGPANTADIEFKYLDEWMK